MAKQKKARATRKPARSEPDPTEPARPELPFPVVGIGASAGGIEAVKQLLGALPGDTGMSFVLIQHLDPSHQSMLTDILSRTTKMPMVEVTVAVQAKPDHVYVIAPGTDLVMTGGRLKPSKRTETRGQHRSIDLFLRSLAEHQGHNAVGVVLSGSATDGTLGLEEVKAAGGITFAQDSTAQHESMPRSAIASGCVDFVLPADEIGRELGRIARHPYVSPAADAERALILPQFTIGPILDLLHRRHGVDFSHYKRSTLFRRISRRMVLTKAEALEDYLRIVTQSPDELEALYQDILINVTSFFRNPEAYEALKTQVFPKLLEGRSRHEPLRFWALGCSTGEEAYSLVIALSEYMEDSGRRVPMQLFATDLNGAGIERARHGVYSRSIIQDVSAERLRRFFIETDGGYQIRRTIRDACVFARHNVLSEPPFSRIDFVSCRNLLIYLGQEMQQRVIPILHYALQPKGYLWLGTSETIGAYRDLFELEDTRNKIYRKKSAPPRHAIVPAVRRGSRREADREARVVPARGAPDAVIGALEIQREAERVLLARYAPASVLVDENHDILQFRGNTGLFLAPAPGRASLNVLKMLREGLLVAVRAALHKAKKDEAPVRKEALRVKTNGGYRDVNIEVLPVKGNSHDGRAVCFLILFEEGNGAPQTHAAPAAKEIEGEHERGGGGRPTA